MKIMVDKQKGIMKLNSKVVKLQPIYYKKYDDSVKLNKLIEGQLRFTKKGGEQGEKHFFNAFMLYLANKNDVTLDNIKMLNWLEPNYIPKMIFSSEECCRAEKRILTKQENQGIYDL